MSDCKCLMCEVGYPLYRLYVTRLKDGTYLHTKVKVEEKTPGVETL